MAIRDMSRPVRVLLIAALSAGTLVLILFLVFVWFTRRPFPDVRGEVELSGVSARVEILRDDDGVPHIWASTAQDLYFAQGWVHAQDRAWQMEFQRRVGRGRLAEVLGKKLVDTDRYLRTVDYAGVAEEEYRRMEEPYRSWMDSYAEGVTAYFDSRPPSRLGLEFAILKLTGTEWDLEPWVPADSLVWGKMVVQSLTGNISDDAMRLNLLRFIGLDNTSDWYVPYRDDMPVTVDEEELEAFREYMGIPDTEPTRVAFGQAVAAGGDDGGGTNVWNLSPELSASGSSMLVSDMHLGVMMPSIWYEVGLHLEPAGGGNEMHVRGYSFPGIPGIVSGQNEHIAWGQANLRGDVQDYVIEKVHPENPNLYLVGDEWIPMEVKQVEIRVEGEVEPVIHQVRKTRHGPIMTDLERYSGLGSFDFADGSLGYTELAMNWTALEPSHLLESIFMLNRAEDWNGFRSALEYWDAPSINFVYADAEGNIGYQAAGLHPQRPRWQGTIPVPGWVDDYEVTETVPFDQLPAAFNPSKGFLVSSNNALVYEEYPYYIGNEYSPGFRARRISELITGNGGSLTGEDIAAVFMDTWSLQASETLPFFESITAGKAHKAWLGQQERWKDEDAGNSGDTRKERKARVKKEEEEAEDLEFLIEARNLLVDWDKYVETDSAGAAAFAFIWARLLNEVYADQLPDYLWPAGTAAVENSLYYLLRDPGNWWWDDRRTPEIVETRDEILARALAGGLFDAREKMGDKLKDWEWGEVHQVEFRNATLGESGIAPIESIFNRGPYPIRGGNSQVHKTNWKISDPFTPTTIPSQRAIYNLADPSASLFINTLGQSGHPYHRHYDDMVEAYLEGDFHPSRFNREEAEDSAGGRKLLLLPGE